MDNSIALILTRRFWPQVDARLRDLLIIAGGCLLVAALAQVRLPLPFTPVPLTGQTFAVLLVGATLGSRRGAASLVLYLVSGLAGLPVFTGLGSGLSHLAGPTGGYLIGFIAAAFATGWLCERKLDRRWSTALLPFLVGEALIYLFGLPWLAAFVGISRVMTAGLIPFLPGDAVKVILAAITLPTAWKYVGEKRVENGE
jgi:biotin transport system substrate-specific component